jgi:predicted acylesterase/phospholipase RssA
MKKVARILSIDGGGIRGVIPSTIIAEWEKSLGPIANHFHMLSGTSTGGILACALAQGISADKLCGFYRTKGPSIFQSQFGALGGVAGELYDATNLVSAVKSVLKGKLSQVEKDLLITSYNIEARQPHFFKSWKARGYELGANETSQQNNFQITDVARCTSAAPTFFSPALVKNEAGRSFPLIDGGVFANNPAMCAYVAARRLYPKATEYVVVSLGTGSLVKPVKYSDATSFGLAGWLRPLLDIMFDGVASTTEYELSQLGITQYRFQTSLDGASEAMDDATEGNLNNLQKVAKETISKNQKDMDGLVKRLMEKVSPLSDLGYPKQTDKPKPAEPVTILRTNADVVKEVPKDFFETVKGWLL